MDGEFVSFFIFLSIIWFLVYWVLGGVFFALVTLVRLGRVRKVRFSCLFSLLSAVLGVGVAYVGLKGSQDVVEGCLVNAQTNIEMVTALFGCGFANILGTFLLGALLLTIGGFFIMAISKSKTKPWLVLDPDELPREGNEERSSSSNSQSKFF